VVRDRLSVPQAIRAAVPTTLLVVLPLLLVLPLVWGEATKVKSSVLLLGVLGLWRYGWQLIHNVRAWVYKYLVFPGLRRAVSQLSDPWPERLFFLIPSFQEDEEVSRIVFNALMEEVWNLPCQVILAVSVGSEEEAEIIRGIVDAHPGHRRVQLNFLQQQDGKRIAMGHALRAIARQWTDPRSWDERTWADDVIVFMDGDTRLDAGSIRGTIPMFKLDSNLGALTTDERVKLFGGSRIVRDWFDLKFIRRHLLMQSHALSGRVLTLTGRFSAFRAHTVLSESFIERVENDGIDHWLFGRIRFQMGDDKSTWFSLLEHGWRMLYVPDVTITSCETRQKAFLPLALGLMQRWYGNMLRTNWRALALGPRRTGGLFIWWCILDQRISMWTTLIGPTAALLAAFFITPWFLMFYVCWVSMTRLLQLWLLVLQGFRIRLVHVPLMLFDQWVGSVVKIANLFHLDRQSWSKNGEEQRTSSSGIPRLVALYAQVVFICLFLVGIASLSGLLNRPSWGSMQSALSGWGGAAESSAPRGGGLGLDPTDGPAQQAFFRFDEPDPPAATPEPAPRARLYRADRHGVIADDGQDDSMALQALLDRVETPARIELPAGRIDLDRPLMLRRNHVELRGRGATTTLLAGRFGSDRGAAVIHVLGTAGPRMAQLEVASSGLERVLRLDRPVPERGVEVLWLGAPNDEPFLESLGGEWRGDKPWLRQVAMPASAEGRVLALAEPPRVDLPVGTWVRRPAWIQGVKVRDLGVTVDIDGVDPASVRGVFDNVHPDVAVDGVRFEWALDGGLDNVDIAMAGRHPLVFERSHGVVATRVHVHGAWNKGTGGTGYVRFARAWACELRDSTVEGVRHVAFQWSAARNRISGSVLRVDVNFHGGLSHHNRVEGTTIKPPPTHPWPAVVRTGKNAHWAPPDGAGNHVEGVAESDVATRP